MRFLRNSLIFAVSTLLSTGLTIGAKHDTAYVEIPAGVAFPDTLVAFSSVLSGLKVRMLFLPRFGGVETFVFEPVL